MTPAFDSGWFARGFAIGAYRVIERLGDGGMGMVYIAEHALIGKRVAVKVLRGEYGATPQLVERFFNEARVTSSIRHPGIVEVFDFGYTETAQPYIVMELLEGRSLATRLAGGQKLPIAEALSIARGIASALAAAHARGVVHRDLKPDNVFLVPDPDGGDGRVKLLDFGIAKLGGDPSGARTRTGLILGTPQYMSPEQCRGASACDHRSDLYSLGCVLFEMIAGRPPFVGDFAELLAGHLNAPPPTLAAPPEIRALVSRLLAKDPTQRPRSAALLGAELERVTLDERTRPVSPPRRRRVIVPITAAMCIALALVLTGWLRRGQATMSAPPSAVTVRAAPVVVQAPRPPADAAVPLVVIDAPVDAATPTPHEPARRARVDAAAAVVQDDVTIDLEQPPDGGVDTPVP
jgi:serine/threonine-protein kinase